MGQRHAARVASTERNRSGRPKTSLAEIKALFARNDEWLFLAGHFTDHLYNEGGSIRLYFEPTAVRVIYDGQTVVLKKGEGFKQHLNMRDLFWGGCSVHSEVDQVRVFRQLFGNSTYVGWRGTTGWQMVDINLGGKGDGNVNRTPNFFTYMNGKADASLVKEAWLKSADNVTWGRDAAGNAVRPKFSVIDSIGQEWILIGEMLPKKGWEKGRKF